MDSTQTTRTAQNARAHEHSYGYDSLFIVPGTAVFESRICWRAEFRFRCFDCGHAEVIGVRLPHRWRPSDVEPNILKAYGELTEMDA